MDVPFALAGCLVADLWRSADSRKWVLALATIIGLMAACAPWAWRNYTTFHSVFFTRSNLGLELRVSNFDGAVADLWAPGVTQRAAVRHPGGSLEEARAVRDLGEVEYMRRARQEAIGWIRAHPARRARWNPLECSTCAEHREQARRSLLAARGGSLSSNADRLPPRAASTTLLDSRIPE